MSNETWPQWISRHSYELRQGFEKDFVERVLSRIPEILPSDLQTQYGFRDRDNRQRRIDFVIANKSKGYFLPIELDGANKDTLQHQWADFLQRQNDLLEQFGPLLRFSNRQMFERPNWIIKRIQSTLAIQAKNHEISIARSREVSRRQKELEEKSKALAVAEKKLRELQQRLASTDSMRAELQEAQARYKNIKTSLEANSLMVASELSEMNAHRMQQLRQALDTTRENLAETVTENQVMAKALAAIAVASTLGLLFVGYQVAFSKYSPDLSGENKPDTKATEIRPPSEIKRTPVPASQQPVEVSRKLEQPVAKIQKPGSFRQIISQDAAFHDGEEVVACGYIAAVKPFKDGIYANFDEAFPRESFSAVIWKGSGISVEQAEKMVGGHHCVSGKLSTVILSSPSGKTWRHVQMHIRSSEAFQNNQGVYLPKSDP